jgi:hypothetical protein
MTRAQRRAKKPTTPTPAATTIAQIPIKTPRTASRSIDRRRAAAGLTFRGSLTTAVPV